MEWIVTVVGILLVTVVARDMFHTLFHPVGHGSIASQVMKLVWRPLRLFPPDRRIASLTGPLGLAMVVLTWGLSAVLGWMLIYFAQMPEGFSYGSELNPAHRNALLDSLYVSLVTIATLGFGDIVPTSTSLRLAVPLEALFGFMLLTAAVAWVLQIYPALHRRRVLALQLSTLREARQSNPSLGIDSIPADVFTALAVGVVEARNDFTQYGATYYFRDLEADASLAASLEYATDLAAEATASSQPHTRMAGALITAAVNSLTELLDREFMARLFLDRIDAHTADISRLDARIEEAMAPFRLARELLMSIPGFSTTTAEVFIAETGGDMSVFPSAGHLASWAGVSPGSHESAGRIKSTKTRPANPYLRGAPGVSAMSAARSKNTFFSAKYQRIKSRRGPMRALVAVEHALVITAWNMLTDGKFYRELGTDYYTVRKPAKAKARAVSQLEALGYTVTLTPLAETA